MHLSQRPKEKRGCSNACICMGTHIEPILKKPLMDFDETYISYKDLPTYLGPKVGW